MFGNKNMKDMMSKLQDMKGVVEDSKKRLEIYMLKETLWTVKYVLYLTEIEKLKELFIDQEIYESLEKDV